MSAMNWTAGPNCRQRTPYAGQHAGFQAICRECGTRMQLPSAPDKTGPSAAAPLGPPAASSSRRLALSLYAVAALLLAGIVFSIGAAASARHRGYPNAEAAS